MFAGRRGIYQVENIIFPCISWERSFLPRFPSREKIPCFEEKIPPFQIVQERSSPCTVLLEKSIFSEHLNKISYFRLFFFFFFFFFFLRKVIFHFPSGGKTKFSGKRNIIFPNNTRKIKFQRDFFGKTIFSGRPEKENMVFRAVWIDRHFYILQFN